MTGSAATGVEDGRTDGSLADRPTGAKVGLELPHEAADLHVTGAGSLHRRPDHAHQPVCCTPGRCRRRTPGP